MSAFRKKKLFCNCCTLMILINVCILQKLQTAFFAEHKQCFLQYNKAFSDDTMFKIRT